MLQQITGYFKKGIKKNNEYACYVQHLEKTTRQRDIGTFGEKHRRSQVVQMGGVSVRNRISMCCTEAYLSLYASPFLPFLSK